MYTDRNRKTPYPYTGEFYTKKETVSADGSIFNDDTSTETSVLKTKCDIISTSSKSINGLVRHYHKGYFPYEINGGIPIREGMQFRSTVETVPISGTIKEVAISTLGGCMAMIKSD